MKRLRRAAIVAELTDRLHEVDSWAGETHLQKGLFVLQEMLGVPTGLKYELHKHGPFSFQLRYELGELRMEDVLSREPQRPPYGPRFYTSNGAEQLQATFPKTLRKYAAQIDWVAQRLNSKGVVALEKLATALWVTKEMGVTTSAEERAKRLRELKPHFSMEACIDAVREIDAMQSDAPVVSAP